MANKQKGQNDAATEQEKVVTDIVKKGKTKMKPRGGNSPVIGDNGVKTLPGDNARYASVLAEILEWGDVDRSSVPAMEKRFKKFVNYCMENDIRITNQLTYLAIGIDKDDVFNWENGRTRTPQHSDFIKKVKRFCASYREMLGADGRLNPVTLVWWQKNYDGLVDRSEVLLTPSTPLGDTMTPEQIAERYQDIAED